MAKKKTPAPGRRGSGEVNFDERVSRRMVESGLVGRSCRGASDRPASPSCLRSGLATLAATQHIFRRPRPPTVLRKSAIVLGSERVSREWATDGDDHPFHRGLAVAGRRRDQQQSCLAECSACCDSAPASWNEPTMSVLNVATTLDWLPPVTVPFKTPGDRDRARVDQRFR